MSWWKRFTSRRLKININCETTNTMDEHSESCRLIQSPNNIKVVPELAKHIFLVCSNDPCNFAHLATKVKSNTEEYNLLKTSRANQETDNNNNKKEPTCNFFHPKF